MMLYQNNRVTSFILIIYLSCIYTPSQVLLSALAAPLGSLSASTLVSALPHDNVDVLASYKQARDIRTTQGHEAAVHHYQDLISRYHDVTAASRIAASPSSPLRHDLACPIDDVATKEILNLENILRRSGYNHRNIQRLFGIKQLSDLEKNSDGEWGKAAALAFARGPVYVTPVSARPQSQLPSLLDNIEQGSSLHCLVAMFLLGFAVPKDILSKHLIGGEETISLFESLGLAFPCESDSSVIVPYVHLFPLEVPMVVCNAEQGDERNDACKRDTCTSYWNDTKSVVIVTDCHPTILSRTTVGEEEDGAVMYIGPDSLALVQHNPIQSHMTSVFQSKKQAEGHIKIVDFCTGSGVQALCALLSLERVDAGTTAVCVDVNDRALRFTRFNALLNGIESNRIYTVKADLISGSLLEPRDKVNCVRVDQQDGSISSIYDLLINGFQSHKKHSNRFPSAPFDLILANPPFIPTPEADRDSISENISKRYGLFSSGGASGEDVLRSIIIMSSRLLTPENGMLAIVSEFMNPPVTQQSAEAHDELNLQLLDKLCHWWEGDLTEYKVNTSAKPAKGRGILFTNEFPVSSTTYAARRADDEAEYKVWIQNLEACGIYRVSPGQLYIKTGSPRKERGSDCKLDVQSKLVPQDKELGSIWTPYNYKAILYTGKEWDQLN